MRLIKRVIIALGVISIVSCSHHSGRSGNTRGQGNLSQQPQDGSLIVTPQGTREIKIEPQAEDSAPENEQGSNVLPVVE
jgi:hypothetical protein